MGPVLPPRRPDRPGCDTGEERGSDAGADPGEAGLLEVEGFRLAFEDSAIGMSIEDLDGRFTQVNASLCSMLGYERDRLIGQPYSKVCHPDDLEDDTHLTGLRNGWIPRYVREMRYVRADGATIWVRVHIGVIRGEDGRPRFYTAQIEDISERHRAEQRFRCAFDDAAVGMAVAELRRPGADTLLQVNDATANLLGRQPGEVVGRILSRFVHPDDVATTDELFTRLRTGEARQADVVTRILRPDQTMVWVNLSASVADDPEGRPAYLVLHLQDITARETAEARLIEQAERDALTGLSNRTVLAQRAGAALARGEAALLFVDLDRFKLVNDSLGHATGDELLVAVGRRLAGSVPADGLVARIGGDEFVVLVPSAAQAQDYADSIQEVLAEPFRVGGRLLRVTASVGIAAAGRGSQADDLLRAADLAMYRAKTQGKARSAVYDSSMRADAEVRLAVEQDLHRAVETPGELIVWFQPTISLVTGRIVLAEALVRWVHPERGLLLPSEFLPVAEETGMIGSIGWLVLDQTLREVRSWRDAGLGVVGSVNLSGNQLDEPGFAEHVGAALRRNALLPADLCLEVTERVLADPASPAASTVEALRRYGVAIAIDDFGRGQSSLAYLRDHPVDIVKIDGVFVTALETNPRDASIVGGMVQLAHALGMTCVAEGVEQEAQLARLGELGCDQVQGYLLARPRPAAEFTAGLIESRGQQSTHRREPASGQRTM